MADEMRWILGGIGVSAILGGILAVGEEKDRPAAESELIRIEAEVSDALDALRASERDPARLRDQIAEFHRLNENLLLEMSQQMRAGDNPPAHSPPPGIEEAQVPADAPFEQLEAIVSARVSQERLAESDPFKLRDRLANFEGENAELWQRYTDAHADVAAQPPAGEPDREILEVPGESEAEAELRSIAADLADAYDALRERARDAFELRDQIVEFDRLNQELLARERELAARVRAEQSNATSTTPDQP